MKILLVAVNARYIHTCPAVYSLKACAQAYASPLPRIQIAEYTINDRYGDILTGILEAEPDILAFSTYIWNIGIVQRLICDIRKIKGKEIRIWAGGPEASYTAEAFLQNTGADLVMLGEGEVTFSLLAQRFSDPSFPDDQTRFHGIRGIAYRKTAPENREDTTFRQRMQEGSEEEIVNTGFADPADLSSLPFLYPDLSVFSNRILYYESSRGCPFGCAYCLSGKERGVRCRDLDLVRKELQVFLDHKVRQVKFVDRTFNADPERALAIWRYIRDHDNRITNFHFEIEADRMIREELSLLADLRPGLVQLEIGVQSANPLTLRSVHRNTSLDAVERLMTALVPAQNINLHLDLIAGLPFEDLASFRSSFNVVYAMRPHQLQLGFLKLLPGTELYERREEYGLVASDTAPYEVLRTKWMSFGELSLLHRISDRVEEFLCSQGFRRSLPLAQKLFPDAFSMFEALAAFYHDRGYESNRPSVQQRYRLFEVFIQEAMEKQPVFTDAEKNRLLETIRLDQALHVHPSRKMQAAVQLNLGEGLRQYRIDYLHCSPVNGEAALCYTGTVPV